MPEPPVCDYEGSDYQASFWDQGDREYEDRVEAIALKRLLPRAGNLLLELGAGAGRNTARYLGFERIVLLDYSLSQLEQAQTRLGGSEKYVYVAADANRLPFVKGLFDAATMIRALHHMSDPQRVLEQVWSALASDGTFVLEFANKRNLKAITRYWLGRQAWNPFSREAVEFTRLNFDFHPAAVRAWLTGLGFRIEQTLTVSHFRWGIFKRLIPLRVLVALDSLLQWTGGLWQLTPSVFVKARGGSTSRGGESPAADPLAWFRCLQCGYQPLGKKNDAIECSNCGTRWAISHGIYDFRRPLAQAAGL